MSHKNNAILLQTSMGDMTKYLQKFGMDGNENENRSQAFWKKASEMPVPHSQRKQFLTPCHREEVKQKVIWWLYEKTLSVV